MTGMNYMLVYIGLWRHLLRVLPCANSKPLSHDFSIPEAWMLFTWNGKWQLH